MRPAVERHDADVMDHLVGDHHVVTRLHDLQVVVVRAGQERRSGVEQEAALGEGAILWTIRRSPPATGLGASGGKGLARRRQRRNPAVWWIDDERRTFRPDDLRPTVV